MKNASKLFGAQGKSLCAVALAALMASALAFTACSTDPASAPVVPVSGLDELSRAIRHVSDYLNGTIPGGSMVVFMNVQSDSEPLSDFIIDELLANAVNDRVFTVVDRQQLDVIRTEQNLQLSGEVDDETALSVGRFLGAQTIVSGRISSLGGHYRLTIRALEVETARLQGQYNQNIGTVVTISALMGGGGTRAEQAHGAAAPAQQTVQVPGQQALAVQAQLAQAIVTVEGATLAERLDWIQANAANNTVYSIVLTANESIIPQTLAFPRARNVTVRLSADGEERVISLPGSGTLFTVEAGVTLVLDNNVTLQGRDRNNATLVVVNRGTLIMNEGARITGNRTINSTAGVSIRSAGTFTMNGGEISNNANQQGSGGGVFVNGSFTMAGGAIFGNRANLGGGGVYVSRNGSFTMTGGEIFDNGARFGGGLRVPGQFVMSGGEIIGNSAHHSGGGVFVSGGRFTMTSGVISGNTATQRGGGVYGSSAAVFTKTGGTIYGFESGNGNRARSGHAVAMGGFRLRNSTAGPGVNLDFRTAGAAGGWEN